MFLCCCIFVTFLLAMFFHVVVTHAWEHTVTSFMHVLVSSLMMVLWSKIWWARIWVWHKNSARYHYSQYFQAPIICSNYSSITGRPLLNHSKYLLLVILISLLKIYRASELIFFSYNCPPFSWLCTILDSYLWYRCMPEKYSRSQK